MLSFIELNRVWREALRTHAVTELIGENGPYRPIGDKSLKFLDAVWKGRSTPLPDIGQMLAENQTVRFFGDTHFDHLNILHMCNRAQFESIDQMNEILWQNIDILWQNIDIAHANSDLVVCVGDLSLRNPIFAQKRLNTSYGQKHLTLIGNHDIRGSTPTAWIKQNAAASLAFSVSRQLVESWFTQDELYDYIKWKELPDIIHIGVSHWPVPTSRLPSVSWLNLHGHIHNRIAGPLNMNCSVEAIDYKPATLQSLLSIELLDNLVRRQYTNNYTLFP